MGEMIPIVGMITGVMILAVVTRGLVKLFDGPVGVALGKRILGRTGDADHHLADQISYMSEQLEQLERSLAETQERLDFAERMLARAPETPPLRSGATE